MPFKLNSKFFEILGNLASFVALNLLFILCCIPIFTAGAAISAMYYVMLKIARQEEPNFLQEFLASFKENLKQGTIINMILIAVGAFIIFDLKLSLSGFNNSLPLKIITFILFMVALVYLLVLTFVYPVLAQFTNTTKKTFYNALLLSITHLPFAFLILLLNALPVLIFFIWPNGFLMIIPFYFFIGFALICYISSLILKQVFGKYIALDNQ